MRIIQVVVLYSCICICYNLFNQPPFLGLEYFFNAQERTVCQMVLLGLGVMGVGRSLVKKYT